MTVSPTAAGETAPETWICWPKVAIGTEAAIETEGGGPVTLTVPLSVGFSESWYGYVPGVSMRLAKVRPGRMIPEAKAPLFATTWWFMVSTFFHRTVSPPRTVTVLGLKAVDVMFTFFVAVSAATANPAPARAHTAAAIVRTLFIGGFPPGSLTATEWNGPSREKLLFGL